MAEADTYEEVDVQKVLSKWGVDSLDPSGLYTFSSDPELVVEDVPMPKGRGSRSTIFKPEGIWYSPGTLDDSWLWWCAEDGGEKFLRQYLYRLELDYRNILRLTSPEEIFAFTEEYGYHELGWDYARMIAWQAIWKIYDGLEIIPYQWGCRLEPATHWYYGWDCASGCVWRASAVKSVELVGSNPEKEDE